MAQAQKAATQKGVNEIYYHGTTIPGITALVGKPVYLTDSRAYALFYIMDKEINWVTCGIKEDDKIHYDEWFPDQLRILYSGKSGFLYTAAGGNFAAGKSRGIFLSEKAVPVASCAAIPDVYEQILRCAATHEVVIQQRYAARIGSEAQEDLERMVGYIIDNHLLHTPGKKADFIRAGFPQAWELSQKRNRCESSILVSKNIERGTPYA